MTLRRVVFWTHLSVGAGAAIVILMMSVTGVILTYEMQLNEWARKDYRAAPPAPGVEALPVDTLLVRAGTASPEAKPSSIAIGHDPLSPAAVAFGRAQTLYVDRYTGEIRGDGNTSMRQFLRSVMYIHRWFALEGDSQAIGRAITGTANLGFLFLVVSGFYLWWPRNWTWRALRNVTWFRLRLSPKARDFNWHNVIGFWMAIPLAIVIASGAMISYRWVGDLIYFAVGEERPSSGPPAAAEAETGSENQPGQALSRVSYQAMLDEAASASPGWRRLTLRLPEADDAPLTVQVDRGSGRQPAKWTNLTFDQSNGALTGQASGLPESRGLRIIYWLRFAHTGEVYGIPGQTIAGLASAGAAVLVWTGLALAWRRWRVWRRRRKSDPPAKNVPSQPVPVPTAASERSSPATAATGGASPAAPGLPR